MSLVRPALLPDEMAAGYLGRVLQINGLDDWPTARRYLSSVWLHLRPPLTKKAVLAEIAGIEATRLSAHRTLVPMSMDICGYAPPAWNNMTDVESKSGAFFCSHCVQEDQDFHGFSYWRRSHQLPGVFWCEKHRSVLRIAHSGSFSRSPSAIAKSVAASEQRWTEKIREDSGVQRVYELMNYFSTRETPLLESHVRTVVVRSWRKLFLVDGGLSSRPLGLNVLIRSSFDARWLGPLISGFADRVDLDFDCLLDPERLKCPAIALILALAVLFPTASEAARALDNPGLGHEQSKVVEKSRMLALALEAYIATQGNAYLAAGMSQLGVKALQLFNRRIDFPLLSVEESEESTKVDIFDWLADSQSVHLAASLTTWCKDALHERCTNALALPNYVVGGAHSRRHKELVAQ